MDNSIKLSLPHMGGKEQHWVNEAFKSNWVVPLGPNVDEFERLLGDYLGAPGRVVALSAGTAALHLGLVMLGVEAGVRWCASHLRFQHPPTLYCIRVQSLFLSVAKLTHGIWMPARLMPASLTVSVSQGKSLKR